MVSLQCEHVSPEISAVLYQSCELSNPTNSGRWCCSFREMPTFSLEVLNVGPVIVTNRPLSVVAIIQLSNGFNLEAIWLVTQCVHESSA